jgi:NifU-like protein involved in Fe-S cluster formation
MDDVFIYLRHGRSEPFMDDIYNSKILEFAGNIPLSGALPDADASSEKHSKLCGSKVRVYVKMDQDRVTDFSHEVRACALGQASSSIMARHVVGATADEIRRARSEMLAMLKDGGEGPSGRFEDMRYLQPVKDYKARHPSTMLTFDAVVDAIEQIEAKSSHPAAHPAAV